MQIQGFQHAKQVLYQLTTASAACKVFSFVLFYCKNQLECRASQMLCKYIIKIIPSSGLKKNKNHLLQKNIIHILCEEFFSSFFIKKFGSLEKHKENRQHNSQ